MRTPALPLLALAALASFTGCSTFIDEMKIRSDKNTVAYPDIWEMEDLEAREGVLEGNSGQRLERTGPGVTEAMNGLPPIPGSDRNAPGIPAAAPEIPEGLRRANQQNVVMPRVQRPEQPLPDTARDLGTVPVDQIPGLSTERPSYSPDLLEELRR